MADPQSSRGGQSDLPAAVAGEELRASHADRDQVVELLRVAAGDGRLSAEELDMSMHGGGVTLPGPPGPGVPVLLRVEITGSVRGGGITAGPPPPPRRPRRTFWQWLRRAPRPPAIAA